MTARLSRTAVVLYLAVWMTVGAPAYAQTQSQSTGQTQGQTPAQAPPATPSKNLLAGQDYSKGKRWFPNLLSPYVQPKVPEPELLNSPRVDQLVQHGKMMLSLDDAIALALENSLDIQVERYVPWFAETDLLRTKAGGAVRGLGSAQSIILGSIPSTSFDPVFTTNLSWSRSSIPVNNPFLSGVGTTLLTALTNYNAQANFGYSQGFHTGTAFSVAFDNARSSTTSPAAFFNPAVQSSMIFTFQQQLLNGFGLLPNTRFILEAKNNKKIADLTFALQVITTVTAVKNQYWELVFARENVNVEQAALATSEKLYEDNKRQLEIGTLAPLDVLTAESEVATDRQNLIVAQTTQLQQQTLLMNLITKNPLDPAVQNVEIVPTTSISALPQAPTITLADAVKEAWSNRPELRQEEINLKNAGIEVRATRNALLPILTLFGQYESTGLGGNTLLSTPVPNTFIAGTNPIVDANGTPALVNGMEVFTSRQATTVTPVPGGVTDSLQAVINNNFPTYAAGLNLTLPIRNRSAQADSARALLDERQLEVQYHQLQSSIVVDVRNALIALQQDEARVAAAVKAGELAQQTLDAEEKKYQLGASTSYNVVLRSRDLTAAKGNELRAKADLEEAEVNFNKAMGRTLDVNHIVVADAKAGTISSAPLIPGTINGKLVSENQQ